MGKAQNVIYAAVGFGDLTVEKVRSAGKIFDQKKSQKIYDDYVKRGRTLSRKIRNSGPTKQALAQTKSARAQVKAATTSVTKAARANARATTSAVRRTSKAS